MHIVRAVMALVLAAPFFLVGSAAPVLGEQSYTAVITMTAPVVGQVQLFYDDGTGITEAHSSRAPTQAGREAYRLRLPTGTIRALRLDPGLTGGRYIIEAVEILRPGGGHQASIPPEQFVGFHQLAVAAQTATGLTLDSPAGSNDPHAYIQPPAPLELPVVQYTRRGLAAKLAGYWGVGFVVILLLERLAVRMPSGRRGLGTRLSLRATKRPGLTILLTSVIATGAATYPLLLFGRSLVTPNNGPIPMLYDHAPFGPGWREFGSEHTRGSDVGAMMWAFVPYSKAQRVALAEGEWPLWMRSNGAGRPLWGQGQSFFLDPMHWLTFLGDDPAPGWDLKFVAHRFVFSAGVGAAAWLATGSLWAAATVAAMAPFIGLYTFRFNHPATFAPTFGSWMLVGWFLIRRAMDWPARCRGAMVLALSSALVLVASPPKEAALMLAGCHLAGLLSVLLSRRHVPDRVAGLVAASGAGVAMLFLTAPHWLIFLETLGDARTLYDSPAVHLATLESLQGFVLGNLSPGSLQPGLNAVAVAFALVCLAMPWRLIERGELAACALAALALVGLVAGAVPTAWLLQIPLIRNVGHLADTAITALLVPTLVLTAAGLRTAAVANRAALAGVCLLLGGGATGLWLTTGGLAGLHRFDQWLVLFVLGLASLAPLLVSIARRFSERALPSVCAAATIFAVVGLGGLHLPTGIEPLDELLPQPRLRVRLDANSPALDAALRQQQHPVRTAGEGNLLFQGTEALYDLEGIGGPDALSVSFYEELVEVGGLAREWGWRSLIPQDSAEQVDPLLDLLNVGLLVRRQAPPGDYLTGGQLDGDDWIDVIARPSAWPRAYFVDGVSSYDSPGELISLARAGGGPLAGIEAADPDATRLTRHLPGSRTVSVAASAYVLTTNTTQFVIETTGPGVAVLSETYIRDDFRATLNGQPVEYFRANHAFKAVIIPAAGTWNIAFAYRPARWETAWVTAVCGLVLLLALAIPGLRFKGPGTSAEQRSLNP